MKSHLKLTGKLQKMDLRKYVLKLANPKRLLHLLHWLETSEAVNIRLVIRIHIEPLPLSPLIWLIAKIHRFILIPYQGGYLFAL